MKTIRYFIDFIYYVRFINISCQTDKMKPVSGFGKWIGENWYISLQSMVYGWVGIIWKYENSICLYLM